MPIKIDIVDSSSTVKAKAASGNSDVKLRPTCGANAARYESLIAKESQERKAADDSLRSEKQNKGFIRLEDFIGEGLVGRFDANTLSLLNSCLINKISYGDHVYSLSVSARDKKTYFCSREIAYNKIEVDCASGAFILMANDEHTVTQEQIDF